MSTLVSTLVTSITSACTSVLPVTYKALEYTYDITKNTFNQSNKRYGVIPLSATEITTGVTKAYTVDHRFRVILTDGWDTSMKTDADRQSKVITLQDAAHDIYKEVYQTRNGSTTLWCGNLTLSEPEFLDDNRVIVISLEFDLRYRNEL